MLAFLLAACSREDLGTEYTEPIEILDGSEVQARGWARRPLFGHDRDAVPEALRPRLREWDFYVVHTPDFAIPVTLAEVHLGDTELVFASVVVHDYASGEAVGPSFFQLDQGLDLGPDPGGSYEISFSNGTLTYGMDGGTRVIDVTGDGGSAHLEIGADPGESLALVTPYAEPTLYFYENKALPLPASGWVEADGRRWEVTDGLAAMDFVRTVMPEQLEWTWATAMGEVGGRAIGVNLGSVYGDEAGGTPNCVVVEGVLHKLGRVDWTFDLADPLQPWRFVSEDGRVDLTLAPDHDYVEQTVTDLGDYHVALTKLYGRFEGTVELDDGEILDVSGLMGAAEYVDSAQ